MLSQWLQAELGNNILFFSVSHYLGVGGTTVEAYSWLYTYPLIT